MTLLDGTRLPWYAPAWNALAKVYARAYQRWFSITDTPRDRLLPLGIVAVDHSLSLDSLQADTWMTRGILTHLIDPVDVAPAVREIRRAIELDSAYAPPWHHLAVLTAELGDVKGALEKWRHCVGLDPAYTQCLSFMAIGHQWRWNADSAAVWADSVAAVDPTFGLARENIAIGAMTRTTMRSTSRPRMPDWEKRIVRSRQLPRISRGAMRTSSSTCDVILC